MDSVAQAFGGAAACSEKAGAVGSRRVGVDGNRTRYQSGAYVSMRERGRTAKLSGTAIIKDFITVSSYEK